MYTTALRAAWPTTQALLRAEACTASANPLQAVGLLQLWPPGSFVGRTFADVPNAKVPTIDDADIASVQNPRLRKVYEELPKIVEEVVDTPAEPQLTVQPPALSVGPQLRDEKRALHEVNPDPSLAGNRNSQGSGRVARAADFTPKRMGHFCAALGGGFGGLVSSGGGRSGMAAAGGASRGLHGLPDLGKLLASYTVGRGSSSGGEPGSASATEEADALVSVTSSASKRFRFATGFSSHPVLARAIVDCVDAACYKLGRAHPLHLCQLLVSAEPHGTSIHLAPTYLSEILRGKGIEDVVVIGGAVQGVLGQEDDLPGEGGLAYSRDLGNMAEPVKGSGPSVSLMAASLPGVSLHAFHTSGTQLPDLPADTWRQLVLATEPTRQKENDTHHVAALLLAEPHFTTVDQLLTRLQGVLPGLGILGGVLQPQAWGERRSVRGAVFLGNQAFDEGAVGCFMAGPIKVAALSTQGCRPVGVSAEVTAARGNAIMQLDGAPAVLAAFEMFKEAGKDVLLNQLRVGLDVSGTGRSFVVHGMSGINMESGAIHLLTAVDIPVGARVRLHLRDPQWACQQLHSRIQDYVAKLPQHVQRDPASLGAVMFSCAALPHDDTSALARSIPDVPLQGGKCQGEFGVLQDDSNSVVLSYSSTIGFVHHTGA